MSSNPQLPIRNLYYMLAYAWRQTPPTKLNIVGAEDAPDALNLFAKLLASGMRELIRRGVDRGYVAATDLLRSPRGKMLVEASLKRQTVRRGAVVCEFDELTANVLHNQLIKSVATTLARTAGLERELKADLVRQCGSLHDVDEIEVNAVQFHRLNLSRNQSRYRPLLRLCELIHRQLLPVKGGGEYRFRDILEDELVMSQLFEDFLLSFYQLEQQRYTVAAENRQWLGHALDPRDWALMPGMRTDLTFRNANQTLIFDAKYYKDPLVTYMGRRQIRAGHLYQLA